jgi:triacylglycerol esterase/lipase EstA (alpha/beta hydrolase family)
MTALILLTLLVGGGLAYVGWAAHCVANGAAAWWFLAGAPIAYFAPVIALVTVWFTLAWIWRTPRPPDARLGLGRSLRLFVGEARAVAASWPLMALHRVLIHDPAPAVAALPIVLIHGVLVNDGVWSGFRRYFARHGIGPAYTINYGPPLADIEVFARQLAAKIDAVCAATGATRVALVGHSMGGLVARAYLRQFGRDRVARLVSIGTPHHGSILAWTLPGRCLAQMHPGNPWLAELNRGEGAPLPVPVMAIWSRHDSMVAPQASCTLACAENIALVGVGHNALLNDRGVMDIVAREIAKARDGD